MKAQNPGNKPKKYEVHVTDLHLKVVKWFTP